MPRKGILSIEDINALLQPLLNISALQERLDLRENHYAGIAKNAAVCDNCICAAGITAFGASIFKRIQ